MTNEAITQFRDQYRFLSNFYMVAVEYEGIRYPSVEHAYQAAKTLDGHERRWVATLATPGVAKRVGRTLSLRADWETIKIDVMRTLLAEKFCPRINPVLVALLERTGGADLIEGNTWGDTFWGVCNGVGENWLGKLLMERREALRVGSSV